MRQIRFLLTFALLAFGLVAVIPSHANANWFGGGARILLEGDGGGAGGSGGGSGGSGAPETITMSKAEYEEEKNKIYRGGLKEGEGKFAKRERERLEKLRPLGINADDWDSAITELTETLTKRGGETSEEMKLLQDKINGLTGQLTEKEKAILAEREGKNNYIINGELMNAAITNNAIDPSDAITVFRSTYRVELLSGGAIHIYDKSGETVKNDKFEPATLQEVMAQMLEKKPHLVKADGRAGAGGSRQEGAPQSGFMSRDPQTWSAAELRQFKEMHDKGEIKISTRG